MVKRVSFIQKLISSLSILCVFGCSNSNDEQDRKELLKWLDHQITEINQQLDADVKKEQQGFYPHNGKTEYHSKGFIDYPLKEKTGVRLLLSQHHLVTLDDIKNTNGYKDLVAKTQTLNLQLSIKEETIDGDEVETSDELDEYIDDEQRYFTITISGWFAES